MNSLSIIITAVYYKYLQLTASDSNRDHFFDETGEVSAHSASNFSLVTLAFYKSNLFLFVSHLDIRERILLQLSGDARYS
jgi:hypothetical protein